jgi:hypothetical protein
MAEVKCASCGALNPSGATVCQGCGASLASPPYVVPADAVVPPAQDTVVVEGSRMSQPAVLLLSLLVLIALVIGGILMYQIGKTNTEMTVRDRDERSASAQPVPQPAPAEPVTTAPPPVIITQPAPAGLPPTTATMPVPAAPAAGQSPVDEARARECARYAAQIDPLVQEWKTGVSVAQTTPSGSLAPIVTQLQSIQQRVSRMTPPPCASAAQSHLLKAMSATIDALDSAAQNDTNLLTSEAFAHAQELFDQFEIEYNGLATTGRP